MYKKPLIAVVLLLFAIMFKNSNPLVYGILFAAAIIVGVLSFFDRSADAIKSTQASEQARKAGIDSASDKQPDA